MAEYYCRCRPDAGPAALRPSVPAAMAHSSTGLNIKSHGQPRGGAFPHKVHNHLGLLTCVRKQSSLPWNVLSFPLLGRRSDGAH